MSLPDTGDSVETRRDGSHLSQNVTEIAVLIVARMVFERVIPFSFQDSDAMNKLETAIRITASSIQDMGITPDEVIPPPFKW